MEKDTLSLTLFTAVILVGVTLYAIYMISALLKDKKVKTPDNRTFRLAFCVVIIVAITFLGLACSAIDENIMTVFGTIAGYVLGGVKWTEEESPKVSQNQKGNP